MNNPELCFGLDFVAAFCKCCLKNSRPPDQTLAYRFSHQLHLVSAAGEACRHSPAVVGTA